MKTYTIQLVVNTYATAEIPAESRADALAKLNSYEYKQFLRDDFEFEDHPKFDVVEADFACEDEDDESN